MHTVVRRPKPMADAGEGDTGVTDWKVRPGR